MQVTLMMFWIEFDLLFAFFYMQLITIVFCIVLDIISTFFCMQLITIVFWTVLDLIFILQKHLNKSQGHILEISKQSIKTPWELGKERETYKTFEMTDFALTSFHEWLLCLTRICRTTLRIN